MLQASIVVPLAVAALGSLATYIGAARRFSGRVATTEAERLWEESAALRQDYRERLAGTEERQAKLEQRVAELETRNGELARENIDLLRRAEAAERMVADQARIIERLHDRVQALEAENTRLTAHVAALEEAHGHA